MNLEQTLFVAGAGMSAQSQRLRIIAENIANADSAAISADVDPYRRQTVEFRNILDKKLGVELVTVAKRSHDMSDFTMRFNPSHPSADAGGYVRMPNVNTILEMVDMKEARRGYEANLGMVEVARAMVQRTLELLR